MGKGTLKRNMEFGYIFCISYTDIFGKIGEKSFKGQIGHFNISIVKSLGNLRNA